MIKVNIIDNLGKKTRELSDKEAEKISKLIRSTNLKENKDSTYTEEEIKYLTESRTPEMVKKRTKEGFVVFLTNEDDEVVGCGMVVHWKDHYEGKYLRVRDDYRKQGLGRQICELREKKLKELGVKEVYIQSLKFENTINFNKKRGFVETGEKTPKNLAIIMKKKL
ncbi:MAG: GNAT family N-acetyltransferase [Nanoarchaeota archaeon]|nr:GNAT family N-acetyltransferase [Nanoarchaeota archaeon]MCG2718097.1 GNAT family N-acetyltransferase [Nanoarchaeota archaeon]